MKNEKKVKAMFIFEMIGRPKEHLKESMEQLIKSISSEQNVSITNKKIHEIKKLDEKQGIQQDGEIFSTFSEIEIEAKDLFNITAISFKYMPAHIEIIYPEDFIFKNVDFNHLLNAILSRLHHYDSIAKSALMNNQILANRITELAEKQGKIDIIREDNKIEKKNKLKKSKKKR